jgi:hypothetical protein
LKGEIRVSFCQYLPDAHFVARASGSDLSSFSGAAGQD